MVISRPKFLIATAQFVFLSSSTDSIVKVLFDVEVPQESTWNAEVVAKLTSRVSWTCSTLGMHENQLLPKANEILALFVTIL